MLKENTYIPLVSVTLAVRDGIAPKKRYKNFDEANDALAAYNINYWEHTGERVHVTADWGAGRSIFYIQVMPDGEEEIRLQDTLQEILEDKLCLPPDGLEGARLEEWAMTPTVLLQSDKHSGDAMFYRTLLSSAEGLNSARFERKKDEYQSVILTLCSKYPALAPFMSKTDALLKVIRNLSCRTQYYKDFLFERGQGFMADGLAAIRRGDTSGLQKAEKCFADLQQSVSTDLAITDERFTYYGFLLYHLFPLDRLELPQSEEPLTDDQVLRYRQRAKAVRLAFPKVDISSDVVLFYSLYAKALDSVLNLSEGTRSHLQVSLQTAKSLRRHGYHKHSIQDIVEQFDPMAPFTASYAPAVIELMGADRKLKLLNGIKEAVD